MTTNNLTTFEKALKRSWTTGKFIQFPKNAWYGSWEIFHKQISLPNEDTIKEAIAAWDEGEPVVALLWTGVFRPEFIRVTRNEILTEDEKDSETAPMQVSSNPTGKALVEHVIKRLWPRGQYKIATKKRNPETSLDQVTRFYKG